MATAALKTTDRIVDASLALFNAKGFANVPLSAIAMSVGISPGNLAYHFKSKTDIVLAVFPQLQEALRQSKREGEPFVPEKGVRHLLEIFRTLWRYRFFFNSLLQLSADDPAMRQKYKQLENNMVDSIQAILDQLLMQGYVQRTSPPVQTELLARGWWLVWLSWLRQEQLESSRRSEPRDSALRDGIIMTISMVQPIFRPDVVAAMLAAVEVELPIRAPLEKIRRNASPKSAVPLRRRSAAH